MNKDNKNLPSLQREINGLKKALIKLGAMVEDNLYQSLKALIHNDLELAKKVIKKDEIIDKKEVEIEEECLRIFVLFQPVAIDLRYIVGVLKVNNDLERIGDLAVNIAKSTKILVVGKNINPFFALFTTSDYVKKMLKMSLDSFVKLDVKLARQILSDDKKVDRLHKKITKKVIAKIKIDKENAEKWMHILTISRCLERAADHTTNIAEDILYMVEGKIKRHSYY